MSEIGKLLESDLLRAMVDSATNGILALELDGRIADCNPACWKALGLEGKEALIGQHALSLVVNRHEILAEFTAVAREGASRKVECTVQVGDAPSRVLEVAFSPLFAAGGRQVGVVAVTHDVAERRRATESLRLVNSPTWTPSPWSPRSCARRSTRAR
jgi:PAS domain S-box-containing protein